MAKTSPNVNLNMSWIHIISPTGVQYGLNEWLLMVPINKILAFGGDLQFVEHVCGHLKIARENVAQVLAEMVAKQRITMNAVLDSVYKLFYLSPLSLYQ